MVLMIPGGYAGRPERKPTHSFVYKRVTPHGALIWRKAWGVLLEVSVSSRTGRVNLPRRPAQ